MLTSRQTHYRRNIFISIIIICVLIIFAYLYLPKRSLPDKKNLYHKPLIIPQEVPLTVKSLPVQNEKHDTSRTYNRDTVSAYKLPEDVRRNLRIDNPNPNENSKSTDQNLKISKEPPVEKESSPGGSASMDQHTTSLIKSEPRLIFEVVPSEGENKYNGKLELSLKINENGQVVDHRILSNSLDCTDCLNAIIQAAYKSKWEPAIVDGKKSDYWVVKSYTFN